MSKKIVPSAADFISLGEYLKRDDTKELIKRQIFSQVALAKHLEQVLLEMRGERVSIGERYTKQLMEACNVELGKRSKRRSVRGGQRRETALMRQRLVLRAFGKQIRSLIGQLGAEANSDFNDAYDFLYGRLHSSDVTMFNNGDGSDEDNDD